MRENRIQIRFSDAELEKLDSRLCGLSRSEYIRKVALGEQGVTGSTSVSKTEGSGSTPDVPEELFTDYDAVELIRCGFDVSTRENWSEVKEELKRYGYGWDITTRVLKKNGLVIKRFG